jgi:TetR/AcrR family transcriptional regulator, cholesterol catabolism regulator
VLTSPPDRPRLRAKYERRREQVIDSAAEAFAARGYHHVSMNDLMDATGLTSGGLYHYIGTKDELLYCIFQRISSATMTEIRAAADGPGSGTEILRDVVVAWIKQVRRFHAHHLTTVQERPSMEQGPFGAEVLAWRQEFRDVLDEILDRVRAEKRLRVEDHRLAVATLQGMVNGAALRAHEWLAHLTPEQIGDAICRLMTD